jgi:3'(2'), 5'-bisphosphate nucleotidase
VPALDIAACNALIGELTAIGTRAAAAILDMSRQAGLRSKADGSPVTAADEAAEAVICDGLRRLAPAVPIISEEQAESARPEIPNGERGSYFLVDPLDGTREFIAGRDEYTVNIALITNGEPVLGIICAPAQGLTWRGIVGSGAERLSLAGNGADRIPIHTRPRPTNAPVVMLSRSHLDARTQAFLDGVPGARRVQCGSSVKFCRLAEGSADLYPRLAPTHDWDIAAGHAILRAAGGRMTAPDGTPVSYGSPNLLVPAFIASGDTLTA